MGTAAAPGGSDGAAICPVGADGAGRGAVVRVGVGADGSRESPHASAAATKAAPSARLTRF
jgi:hypothetical protein